jgi:hypothetical protein
VQSIISPPTPRPAPAAPAPPAAAPAAPAEYILKNIEGYMENEQTTLNLLPVNAVIVEEISVLFEGIVGSEVHRITIIEINELLGTVTLLISSEPFTLMLHTGETKEIDFNNDKFIDMDITLRGIKDGKADLLFKRFTCGNKICDAKENSESCCKDCGCPENEECKENVCISPMIIPAPAYKPFNIYALIAVLTILIIAFMILKKRRKDSDKIKKSKR